MRAHLPVSSSVAVVVTGLLLTGCVGGAGPSPGGVGVGHGGAATAVPATYPASDVLRAWDRARVRAYAHGDVRGLRRLYVEGSTAGTSDVRMLREYLRRGLRVEEMRMQVLALEVLHEDARRLRLVVTDRLAGAVAVGRGRRVPLPQDQASTRVVELVRPSAGGSWRVSSVRGSWRRPGAR